MKHFYTRIFGIAGLGIITAGVCNAQTGALALKTPKTAITIDGSSADWGDSLNYYNSDKKIHYAIANDQTMLYLIVKTKDPVQETNIMAGGLTFSIDLKGRKRSSFSTTFPYPAGNASTIVKPGEDLDSKKVRVTLLQFKKIGISGFKDINDDDLTTTNNYGIKVAANYEKDGSLVFEEAIPLELFHAGDLAKGEWAFNIKLNGVEGGASGGPAGSSGVGTTTAIVGRPSGGGGVRGGRVGPDPSFNTAGASLSKAGTSTIDFWGKFTLAQ